MSSPSSPSSSSDPSTSRPPREGPSEGGRRCDFCGDIVPSVRRVALDREYDRLLKAHQEQYSCETCFHEKEQRRLGLTWR